MLKAVFESLAKTKRDKYVFEDCLNAYNLYLSFIRRRFSLTPDIKIEKMYELFHTAYKSNPIAKPFTSLFEYIQTKSYREIICERIGSIQNIHGGRGRHLKPTNFNKEIFLNFNLPPLHILMQSFIKRICYSAQERVLCTRHSRQSQIRRSLCCNWQFPNQEGRECTPTCSIN